jgi:hypothetical protein
MGVINRHVDTKGPNWGLGPHVLNNNGYWGGFPKASASNNVFSGTQQTAGSRAAPGTQIDYPRNLNVVIGPTASSAAVTGGGISVFGVDAFGSTRSETFGSLAASSSVGLTGSVNFARVDTVSALLSFLAGSSTNASSFTVFVGVGQKLGIPVFFRSTNAVVSAYLGTARQATSSGTASTANQYTAHTGPYWNGGVRLSSAYNSASFCAFEYMNLGFLAPRPTPPQDDRR